MFLVVMIWSFNEGTNKKKDTFAAEVKEVVNNQTMTVTHAYLWMFVALVLLIISSRVLVWSTVSIAELLGISDLVIGLTVIALGTSMPELASSVVAVLKKEHNLALGSILGSNIFNTLVVVGIAGVIHPSAINPEVVSRDMLLMICLTVGLFIMVYKYQQPGQITRPSGLILLSVYILYITHLVMLVLD
jgi:cation:H+ antiporter